MTDVQNRYSMPTHLPGSWLGELNMQESHGTRVVKLANGAKVIIPFETDERINFQSFGSSISSYKLFRDGERGWEIKQRTGIDADFKAKSVTWVISEPSEKSLTWGVAKTWSQLGVKLGVVESWEQPSITLGAGEAWGQQGVTLVTANPFEGFGATWEIANVKSVPASPFLKIDESRDDESKIEEYIAFIKKSLEHPFGDNLAERLTYLFEIAKDDPEEEEMSPESLKFFIYFIRSEPKLNYPAVMLSPLGIIVAEWRLDKNRHFKVKFLEDEYVHYVIFSPNSKDSNRPNRFSGIIHLDELNNVVRNHRVYSWVLKNGK